ncbi:membrane protein [Marinosulfonomonas sp. PRT-SC04]|nr:membrane protein [Marinosulfonomonas sp. PRT-SC04]
MKLILTLIILFAVTNSAHSEGLTIAPQSITEWKAVYGTVETRDRVPARARISGTIIDLDVSEGDIVIEGQRIALVKDDKLAFQLDAHTAQISARQARLKTATEDLERGEALIKRGTITVQRLGQLHAQVDVLNGEIRGLEAQKRVVEQQISEGEVRAPGAGIVLSVPMAKGSVVTPGESIAVIGGGGVFLRLSVPERHATTLIEGQKITIGEGQTGRLVKIYPQIEGGRVLADVEVANLDDRFIGRRIPVRLPVGERQALMVPKSAVTLLGGIDFVTLEVNGEPLRRTVVLGAGMMQDGAAWVEVLTGLVAGDQLVNNHE